MSSTLSAVESQSRSSHNHGAHGSSPTAAGVIDCCHDCKGAGTYVGSCGPSATSLAGSTSSQLQTTAMRTGNAAIPGIQLHPNGQWGVGSLAGAFGTPDALARMEKILQDRARWKSAIAPHSTHPFETAIFTDATPREEILALTREALASPIIYPFTVAKKLQGHALPSAIEEEVFQLLVSRIKQECLSLYLEKNRIVIRHHNIFGPGEWLKEEMPAQLARAVIQAISKSVNIEEVHTIDFSLWCDSPFSVTMVAPILANLAPLSGLRKIDLTLAGVQVRPDGGLSFGYGHFFGSQVFETFTSKDVPLLKEVMRNCPHLEEIAVNSDTPIDKFPSEIRKIMRLAGEKERGV